MNMVDISVFLLACCYNRVLLLVWLIEVSLKIEPKMDACTCVHSEIYKVCGNS